MTIAKIVDGHEVEVIWLTRSKFKHDTFVYPEIVNDKAWIDVSNSKQRLKKPKLDDRGHHFFHEALKEVI